MAQKWVQMNPNQILLYCGMMDDVNNMGLLYQITSKMNHGIRQETVMAELLNNFIGNVVRLNSAPDDSIDNKNMFQRMVDMVRRHEYLMTVNALD